MITAVLEVDLLFLIGVHSRVSDKRLWSDGGASLGISGVGVQEGVGV